MTDRLLVCHSLRVVFRDGTVALRDVDLTLGEGIVGLVGANGAGKTTLLQLMAGLLAPSAGSVLVGGRTAVAHRVAFGVGCIPDAAQLPPYMRVAAFLDGLRRASGSPAPTGSELAIQRALGVSDLASHALATLSLGQRRRVELCAALIGDPDVLLLDEPTNGLDPLAMTALRCGLLEARRRGRLIVVSSHHLDELQRIADWVVLMHEGRVVASEAAGTLLARGRSLEEVFIATAGAHHA